MPLRSDFAIRAVTPDPPETTEEPSARPMTAVDMAPPEPTLESLVGDEALSEKLRSVTRQRTAVAGTPPRAGTVPPLEPLRRVAFLVVHGMGQQVPFETLSVLGQALITQDDERKRKCGEPKAPRAAGDPPIAVRRVRLTQEEGAQDLSRVEVQFRHKGQRPVDVHLYESYWAPLTEGQISFLQTVRFLYSAAWNGMKTYFRMRHRRSCDPTEPAAPAPEAGGEKGKHFDRWMFGRFHDMPVKRGTFLALLGFVLLVSVLLIPALLVFTTWGIAFLQKHGPGLWQDFLRWRWWGQGLLGLGVAGFLLCAWYVHYFVVEYVGDVAIYVSSYKVSRFDAIRNQIQQAVRAVAHEIYSAGVVDASHPQYDEVVIVGHSLGSVIAYDALNEAINWDEVECAFGRKVVERTTRLITFGSPLDKTAFLFRTQVSAARNLREALAARQQPLILDYGRYRPKETFDWINIWSPWDIVSGHLDYYDVPEDEAKNPHSESYQPKYNPVKNHPDPEATTPLLAHVQYWDNRELHEALYEAVSTRAAATS